MKPRIEDEADEMGDRTDLVPLIDCVFLVLLFYVVAATLRACIAKSGLKTLIIRGDKAAPYERIARVFELAQSLGITDLAMVEEARETPPTPGKYVLS